MNKILFRTLRKLGLLKFFNFHTKISIQDRSFIVPVLRGIGLVNYLKVSEPWMLYILDKVINELKYDKVFVDVGMNLGQTLIKTKSVSQEIDYVGFEPNPICFHYLNNFLDVNQFKNVEIFPIGIGKKTSIKKLSLFDHSDIGSSASIVKNFRKSKDVQKKFNVPVFDVRELQDLGDISILKIDVEGAELEVMEGLIMQIRLHEPIILLEVLPNYNGKIKERVIRQQMIESILEELNYAIFRIVIQNSKFKKFIKVLDFGKHSDLNKSDYMLTPNAKIDVVKETFR